jgi:subtilisin family serine protease
MSFDLRKVRKAHFLALAILAFGAACQDSLTDPAPTAPRPNLSLAADSSGEFYYYQGAKVFLDVDPSRLVVVGPATDGVAGTLRGIGVTTERAERLQQAPNHWVIRLAGATTAVQAAAARTLLKADTRYRFVSNVYKTRSGGDDVIPLNRVIVQFKSGVSSAQSDSLISALGLTLVRPPRPDSGFTYDVLEYPRDSVSSLRVAALLDRSPLVAWADPDKVSNRHPDFVPSDPYYPLQYYLKNTVVRNGVTVDDNVESAWDLTTGQWAPSSGGLRVGVIGTGIDASHPDFDGRIVTAYDALQCYPGCSDDATHPYPGDNHETLVTGIIVGQHNGSGIAGIAPGVYIAAGRIFRGAAVASDQGIADVINFMWDYASAQVINNSWGGGAPSNAITSAIVAANSQGRAGKGTVVVFAAGNTSARGSGIIGPVQYPATLAEVVAVGAIDRNGDLTDYSPEGTALDIVAPSGHYTSRCVGDVTTTDRTDGTGCNDGPNGDNLYSTTFSGTSAAAPQVTAVAALVISRTSTMTATSVKNKLYQTAVSWGPATQYGAGKLNALAAVSNVAVSVSGLTTIKREGGYTWTASATGGNGSYTYAWERSEAGGPYYPVGSGTSYSEYFDANSPMYIDLRVTATSGAETGQVVKRVNNLIVP